jgi:protein-tyrosine sulfotransferase
LAWLTWKQLVRRVYRDLVRGRTSVRIAQPSAATGPKRPPIFLTGTYRQGTTLVRYIVDSHSQICCPPETHFAHHLAGLIEDEETARGLATLGYDRPHVIAKAREFLSYFFEGYAASKGKPRWADKTPHYVDCLEFLARVFPEAVFVTIYRNGLDQAQSFTHKGTRLRYQFEGYCQDGEDMRIGATRYWAIQSAKVLKFEKNHPERCFRILYEDLCAEPEARIRELMDFLDEPWEPSVLSYQNFEHDVGFEDPKIHSNKTISASSGNYADWDPEVRRIAYEAAQPVLDELGYSITL